MENALKEFKLINTEITRSFRNVKIVILPHTDVYTCFKSEGNAGLLGSLPTTATLADLFLLPTCRRGPTSFYNTSNCKVGKLAF